MQAFMTICLGKAGKIIIKGPVIGRRVRTGDYDNVTFDI